MSWFRSTPAVAVSANATTSYTGGMRRFANVVGRLVSALGLTAVAALHFIWASGSPWPARTTDELATAVVGSTAHQPRPEATLVVAIGATGTAILATGALGRGPLRRGALRIASGVLIARAIFGGNAALATLGLPPAGPKFLALDNRYYRPFAAIMAVALWLAATRRTTIDGSESFCDGSSSRDASFAA